MSDQNVRRPMADPFAESRGRISLPPRPGSAPAPEFTPGGRGAVPAMLRTPEQETAEEQSWESVDEVTSDEADLFTPAEPAEPEEEFVPLTTSQNHAVASIIAAHRPEQPMSLLFNLLHSDDWQVRDTLARNETVPEAVLMELASDEDPLVRRSLLRNPAVPDHLYAQFEQDPDPAVLIALVEHPRTSGETLNRLAYHEDFNVAEAAVLEMERILEEDGLTDYPS